MPARLELIAFSAPGPQITANESPADDAVNETGQAWPPRCSLTVKTRSRRHIYRTVRNCPGSSDNEVSGRNSPIVAVSVALLSLWRLDVA